MQETFADRDLVAKATVGELSERNDGTSAVRFVIHVACILAGMALGVLTYPSAWAIVPVAALSFLLATMFAPFHECTHGTAFATPKYNRLGALVSGVLFGWAWRDYRSFHFLHHSHTQDRLNDPEIVAAPDILSPWPNSIAGWLVTLSGVRLLQIKFTRLIAGWLPSSELERDVRRQAQLISGFWLAVATLAAFGFEAAIVLGLGFLLSHIPLALWLTGEHSGCAESGSILERTRSVESNRFVRFFLWNMNYHTEHHGWPAVPWHQLPRLHALTIDAVSTHSGYAQLYYGAMSRARTN